MGDPGGVGEDLSGERGPARQPPPAFGTARGSGRHPEFCELPEGTYAAGRVDAATTVLHLSDAPAAKNTAAAARSTSDAGTPAQAGENILEEARWLISVWTAWKHLKTAPAPAGASLGR
ncbi:hypothetical protein GCM10010517_44300 [Streptosporangium fragile]|uniref:Uncharacterized protein n=1 Tax=Streptosporangium fragile TaxID=46186 RepID=A0ABN3W0C1_9ACTN